MSAFLCLALRKLVSPIASADCGPGVSPVSLSTLRKKCPTPPHVLMFSRLSAIAFFRRFLDCPLLKTWSASFECLAGSPGHRPALAPACH